VFADGPASSTVSVRATIVVVQTNPGYAANPGHDGTGKIIAVDCG
jgi:hypothetical protein